MRVTCTFTITFRVVWHSTEEQNCSSRAGAGAEQQICSESEVGILSVYLGRGGRRGGGRGGSLPACLPAMEVWKVWASSYIDDNVCPINRPPPSPPASGQIGTLNSVLQNGPTKFYSRKVFYMLFDRSLSIFSTASLKQHMEYMNFNFRC